MWCLPRGFGECSGGRGTPRCLAAANGVSQSVEVFRGEPEVSDAPVEVELDASEVTEGDGLAGGLPGDLTGAGDCLAEPEVGDDGLSGWLTVAAFSFESISNIFFPAMLWKSKVFHHIGPDVHGATDDPVSDGLDSLEDSAKDPQFLDTTAELGTLEV